MINLPQIEQDLVAAMKSKDQIAVDTLRGLKTRIQNERIAKTKDLSEADIVGLIRNEVKRRKEASQTYITGGRQELADKELLEAAVLEKYLPAQMPEADLAKLIDDSIVQNNFTAADFGKAMGKLKAQVGDKADGAALAKLLKEKLK
jgi:uncharacterized protein YqeY